MIEKEYWLRFLNKKIRVIKNVNQKSFFYSGEVIAVFDDKIILKDHKIGEIPLTFTEMSVSDVIGDSP